MSSFRSLAVVLALLFGMQALPVQAETQEQSGDPTYTITTPSGYAMVGDLIFARPILLALTAIGTAAFVVSLPFTALGGNVKEAGKALVIGPGKATFVRCLGCTAEGFGNEE